LNASYTRRTISTFSCDIAYSRSPAASRASARSANHWSRSIFPSRKLIFGDVNYKPGKVAVREAFYGRFVEVDQATNRSTHGDSKIDYVFVSKQGFRITRSDVPNSRGASDHRPLWADLELI
jgi:endonuclease/exonuclease/phosphatase family metal-dependent hydrolase